MNCKLCSVSIPPIQVMNYIRRTQSKIKSWKAICEPCMEKVRLIPPHTYESVIDKSLNYNEENDQ